MVYYRCMTDGSTAGASRITITLIPSAQASLADLHARTGLSKTDLVNRAITLYEFIDTKMKAGSEVLIRKGDETSVVKFL
jgi:hypothetical protein